MNIILKSFVLTSMAITAEGSNQLRGADYTSDMRLSKTATDDIGTVSKTDTKDYAAASKTATEDIGAVTKTATEDYVAVLGTTTDNIGAVAKTDTEDYVAASRTATNDIDAASKIATNGTGGYEVYAKNCFKKTVGAIFFLDEDIDMEAMDNNNGEIFVKEGDCKYVGHTKLEQPKFDVIGQDVDVKGSLYSWPDAYKCKDMGNISPIFLGDTLCGKHHWPSNACFVDLC